MQAVIASGGKQYLVEKDQTLRVELVGDATKLEFVPLLVIDGEKIQVGTPNVSGVKVKAEVLGEVKGDKLKIQKFKAKKRVHTTTGHRQHYSEIRITSIA